VVRAHRRQRLQNHQVQRSLQQIQLRIPHPVSPVLCPRQHDTKTCGIATGAHTHPRNH
jgi:hypothetical protein